MITRLNLLVRRLSRQYWFAQRFFQILTDYCWPTVLGFWEFDLQEKDEAPEQRDEQIYWHFASIDDCRRWNDSGADGFSKDDCGLLMSLIEKGDRVLVGQLPQTLRQELYDDFSNGERTKWPEDLPDCYAVCATDWKPMTDRVSFRMEKGEGIIRTVYTRTACRRRGLATRLYARWVKIASSEHFGRLFVDIETSNLGSIHAAENAGAVRLRSANFYCFRFFKRSYAWPTGSLRDRFFYNTPSVRER